MAILEEIAASETLSTVAIGAVAVILVPVVFPFLAGAARPLLKSAIKGGIMLMQKGQEVAAEMTEMFEDTVAEARAELRAEGTGSAVSSEEAVEEEGAEQVEKKPATRRGRAKPASA
jgi:hypothetical protein